MRDPNSGYAVEAGWSDVFSVEFHQARGAEPRDVVEPVGQVRHLEDGRAVLNSRVTWRGPKDDLEVNRSRPD